MRKFFGDDRNFQSSQQNIVTNDIQNPPKQFTVTIAAGASESINYDHSFLRILSLTGTGLQIRFGQSGTPTDVIGAGVGYELDDVVRSSQLINTSGAPITVTVVLSMGRIYDDRLNVSGSVNVQNTTSTPLFVSVSGGNASSAVFQGNATTTATQITGVITNQRTFMIKNLGTANMAVGTGSGLTMANGFILAPNETLSVDWSNHVFVICASGTVPFCAWTIRA